MSQAAKILIIEDDNASLSALTTLLEQDGHSVSGCRNGDDGIRMLGREPFDVIISDLVLPDMSGIEVLAEARNSETGVEVILVTGHASTETAVKAIKDGAFDYIAKPVNFDNLRSIVEKAADKSRQTSKEKPIQPHPPKRDLKKIEFSNIIGSSPPMLQLFARMRRVVMTESTVLILGESGTGKELVAKAIHAHGDRKSKAFIAVNCAAIPESLLESELFGHVRGSFTGAVCDKVGKFEAANNGTIFLDEIGTLPLHLQTKLLRVLQEQEIEKVGSNRQIKLNVRVISATNENLEEEVNKGRFREDLYYRLNVIPLIIPPLRQRSEDIVPLTLHFLKKNCKTMKRPEMQIEQEAMSALQNYSWYGNIRELENVIERVVAMTENDAILLSDLPPDIIREHVSRSASQTSVTLLGVNLTEAMDNMEKKMIQEALQLAEWSTSRAAVMLSIDKTALVEKMRKHAIPSL